jgi:pimeloyl-ACP methyl ester carboxylesterase
MKKSSVLLLCITCCLIARSQLTVPQVRAEKSAIVNIIQRLPKTEVAIETAFFTYNHLYDRKPQVAERQIEKVGPIFATPTSPYFPNQPIATQIASEGTQSTTFKFLTLNPNLWDIKIEEAPDVSKYGELKNRRISSDGDSLIYDYTHPRYFAGDPDARNYLIHLEFYRKASPTSTSPTKLIVLPVRIVRPAIIMVHGIFGSPSTFDVMATQFSHLPSHLFSSAQISRIQYKKDGPISLNAGLLQKTIFQVIEECFHAENISSAEVDIVCHSMGGLISRKYLVSLYYQKDVNKLITLNTPHSGSQICNLLLHPDYAEELHKVVSWIGLGNTFGGAVDNMRVNSSAINSLRDPIKMGRNPVPMHVLGSFLSPQFLKPYLEKEKFEEKFGVWASFLFNAADIARRGIELFVNELYNGESHDIAVPISSQNGGFSSFGNNVDDIPNILHPGSTDNALMISRVKDLLNGDPNGNLFSLSSTLNPPQLQVPNFLQLAPPVPSLDGSFINYNGKTVTSLSTPSVIHIDSITPGYLVSPKDSVLVYVSGTPDIVTISLTAGGGTSFIYFEKKSGSSVVFKYHVPQDAIGAIKFAALGFNTNGIAGTDTTKFISCNPSVPLLSFYSNPKSLSLNIGFSANLNISGIYQDGIERDITNVAGITYSFKTSDVFMNRPGQVKGTSVGKDTMTVTYQGQSLIVPITVLDAPFKRNGLLVAPKVFLQGPYATSTGMMIDSLRTKFLLPTSDEPYQSMSYQDLNNTTVELPLEGVFDSTGNKGIVDWVWLELRNSTNPAQVVATRSALLRRDGNVVDMDGASNVYFNDVPPGNYYFALRHRNHLGVMTASALTLNTTSTVTIDFTSPSTPTYGTEAQANINGVMVMWGGDVNNNGEIKYQGPGNDRAAMLSDLLNNELRTRVGYYLSDVNMDGQVKYQGPGNDRAFLLSSPLGNNELKVRKQQIPQ